MKSSRHRQLHGSLRSRTGTWIATFVLGTLLAVAACSDDDGVTAPVTSPPVLSDAGDAGDAGDAEADAFADATTMVPVDAAPTDSAIADVFVPSPPYTCNGAPKQCTLGCNQPACTLLCNIGQPADCRWDCPAPTCACTSALTASCELHEPKAVCDVKCEKPECATYCPQCTTEPCAPCETICKTPHCVTHCQAPKVTPPDGGHLVTHCQAPKPSCTPVCDAPVCTWARVPACPAGTNPCPPLEGYEPACAPPKCQTKCDEPAPAPCDIRGCEETCEPLTDCTQTCDAPSCTNDPDTGAVLCDGPSNCKQTCNGGACHVTRCF